MKLCTFEINDKSMSEFVMGAEKFPAFSGPGRHLNKSTSFCILSEGPIPPGEYFILDRKCGGCLGWFYDLLRDRTERFSLYADDGMLDAETVCERLTKQMKKKTDFKNSPSVYVKSRV